MTTVELTKLCTNALAKYPDAVAKYKKGKTGMVALFTGEVMKESRGNADPKMTTDMINSLLNK